MYNPMVSPRTVTHHMVAEVWARVMESGSAVKRNAAEKVFEDWAQGKCSLKTVYDELEYLVEPWVGEARDYGLYS